MFYAFRIRLALRQFGVEPKHVPPGIFAQVREAGKAGRYLPREAAIIILGSRPGQVPAQARHAIVGWIARRRINQHRCAVHQALKTMALI